MKLWKTLFDSLKTRYRNPLKSIRGSEFALDYLQLLCDNCHKLNFNYNESYIESCYWIKIKKVTINPINKKDNRYFQYAVAVGLNYEEIGKMLKE